MKSFIIIAIVTVAMIGVMVPSGFAEFTYPKSYLEKELFDIRVDRYLPRESEVNSFRSASTGNTFDSLKQEYSDGSAKVLVVVENFQTNDDAIKHNESKINKILQQIEFFAEEVEWFWGPSGCTMILDNSQSLNSFGPDTYQAKCVLDNYRIQVYSFSGDEELVKKYVDKIIEIIVQRPQNNNSATTETSGGITWKGAPNSEQDGMYFDGISSDTRLVCGVGTIPQDGKCVSKESQEEGGGCLIATATYGSEMATEVQQLRELRDNTLLNTESGTAFMGTFNDIYYSFSPTIADMEREHPMFKEAVKLAITPMISSLSLMENANSESEVLSIGISVIMLNLGMYLGVPAVVIIGIRKRI